MKINTKLFKIKCHKYIHFFIFLLISSFVLTWYDNQSVLIPFDSQLKLNPLIEFDNCLSIYDNYRRDGDISPTFYKYFYFIVFSFLYKVFGLSFSQKLILFTVVFGMMASFHYFFTTIRKKTKNNFAEGFIILASIFYAINLYVFTDVWFKQIQYMFLFIYFPLSLGLLYKYFFRQNENRYLFYFLLLFHILGVALTSVYIVFMIPGYLLFLIIIYAIQKDKIFFKKLFILLISTVIVCSFIVFNHLLSFSTIANDLQNFHSPAYEQLKNTQDKTTVLNVFRLTFNPNYFLIRDGESYFSKTYMLFFTNPYLIVLQFLFIMILFFPFFFKQEKNDLYLLLLFSGIYVVILFFLKGFNPPFREINGSFAQGILGHLFRKPYNKMGFYLILSLSCLISLLPLYIQRLKDKRLIFSSTIIIFLLIIIPTFPYFTGNVLKVNDNRWPSDIAKIPQDYYIIEQYLEKVSENNILQLPAIYNGQSAYIMANGTAINANEETVVVNFIGRNSMINLKNAKIKYNKKLEIYNKIFSNSYSNISLHNINYIVFNKNWHEKLMKNFYPEVQLVKMKRNLDKNFEKIYEGKYLALYKTEYELDRFAQSYTKRVFGSIYIFEKNINKNLLAKYSPKIYSKFGNKKYILIPIYDLIMYILYFISVTYLVGFRIINRKQWRYSI